MNTITINDGCNQPNRSLSVGLPTQGQYCNEPLLNYQNINVVKQSICMGDSSLSTEQLQIQVQNQYRGVSTKRAKGLIPANEQNFLSQIAEE